jgi:hypothetical protein
VAKKTKETRKPEVGLKVDHEIYTDVTRERDPTDKWSGEDTTSSHSVNGLSVSTEYPDVTACFPVEAGDTVFLVFAVYSTGDSFSHHEDGQIVFVDVFETFDVAEQAAKALRAHNDWYKKLHERWTPMTTQERKELAKQYKSEYTAQIFREDGSAMDVHVGWNGYFERLSYIEVKQLNVNAMSRGRY